jgi:hypothetical protein
VGRPEAHGRQRLPQVLQRSRHHRQWVERVHHQRKLGLHALAEPARTGFHEVDFQQHRPGVFQQGHALHRQHRTVAPAVEKGHSQLVFQIGNGVAYRRLGAQKPVGARAEAARVGHRDEHADLVEGEGIQHSFLIDSVDQDQQNFRSSVDQPMWPY